MYDRSRVGANHGKAGLGSQGRCPGMPCHGVSGQPVGAQAGFATVLAARVGAQAGLATVLAARVGAQAGFGTVLAARVGA